MASDQTAGPVTPVGFNHLVLNVRDIEESHRFWCEMLGFKQVGAMRPRTDGQPSLVMRFYSGVHPGNEAAGQLNHHDIALVEVPGLSEVPEWNIMGSDCAINHVAITYPDRERWLQQVRFMENNGALTKPVRVDHGMTHSVYIQDPNGYGVEVLYELPAEVWRDDIDGALNYARVLPAEQLYSDDTNYVTDFS